MAHDLDAATEGKGGCPCCSSPVKRVVQELAARTSFSRRNLIVGMGTAAVGAWAMTSESSRADENPSQARRVIKPTKELIVQPVLTYEIPVRQEQQSWRHWGDLQTVEDLADEVKRIEKELKQLVASNHLPLRLLPLAKVSTKEEAAKVKGSVCDVMLVYAAGAYVLNELVPDDKPVLFFLRHKSGPISLHYETLHPIFLRNRSDKNIHKHIDVQDVVVDDYSDLAWRFRGLVGLRKTLGQRIIAIGGAKGWGTVAAKISPKLARETWKLDIVTVSYGDLEKRIKRLREDPKAVAEAVRQSEQYLGQSNVTLHTDRTFVDNAFLLYRVLKDLMRENDATAMTICSCMKTVMPVSKTSACLPLSLLNDEGYLAFCESDFAVIPSGILMHHITGLPTFLNDPTWPHHGIVTLAHCTAPRKMNGKDYEPTKIYTHFESDYGAAPKVNMAKGQEVTMVVPEFSGQKWIGAKGKILDHPFHSICRSQIDVAIEGDWERLARDMGGFHWMMVYGDCLKEVGYAIRRLGIEWDNISA